VYVVVGSGVTELNVIVIVLGGSVLVNVSVEIVVEVGRIVDIEVVAFGDMERYSSLVDTYSGPAVAVMLSVDPRRRTAGDPRTVEIIKVLVMVTGTYSVWTTHTS